MTMQDTKARHGIERIRQEPRRRTLTVLRAERLTPKMLRIELSSPDLHDFASHSPDDHIKLFVPDAASPQGVSMRDYTPRRFDTHAGVLTIDFAVHQEGPATLWALGARAGDTLQIGGPRGSQVLADDFDFYLLVGDETALPSIGRRIENLRPGVPVTTAIVVDGPEEVQHFETKTSWTPLWVHRAGRPVDDATMLRDALQSWKTPDGEGYVWIAAEARIARALRDHMLGDRGHPRAWVKAAGYWVRGEPGAAEKFEK